jgi:hypothetical protein
MLEITDNVNDFVADKQSNCTGFVNIFHRVKAFNDHSTLNSSPGNSCKLQIRFPVINS